MLSTAEAVQATPARGPDELSPWSRALRDVVRADAAPYTARRVLVAESFRASEREPWHEQRWAAATAHVLAHCPVRIRPGERLVGWHPNSHLDEAGQQAVREAGAYLASQRYWVPASEGHMALDYPTLLRIGLGGVLADLRARRDAVELLDPERPRKLAFYRAAETALVGLQRFIERYAELAAQLAVEADDPAWRADLETSAAICAHLVSGPARTFREALQLVWFAWLAVAIENGDTHGCFGAGRLDQYLLPYVIADRAAGRLDDATLDDLLDQFLIKCNEFDGRSMSAVILGVAGRTPDGRDGTNELSFRLLGSSDRVRMYFPGLDLLWHPGIDPELMRRACRLLRNGNGQPSFFNDPVIVEGLQRYGVPFEHAVDHLPSTCTETSIQGRCNPWVAWPYVNLALAFVGALFGGTRPDTGSAVGPATPVPHTWDELLAAWDAQLQHAARQAVAEGVGHQAVAAQWRPFPLLSCFIRGCLESGRNISHGGAQYNSLQPEAVGVTNVVDSLAAIRALCFEQGRFTLDDVRAALAANWDGHDHLRRAILRDAPKYGNDDEPVNRLFDRVAGGWCDAIEGTRNHFGGPVFPGFLGWVVWIGYGEATPATPDGRRAGEPLANSLAPRSGVRLRGIPSMLLSASGLDHRRGLGGITVNVRFAGAALADDDGPERLQALVETALRECGLYMVQIDVTSSETMRAAQQRPDDYADLLVRIGGYLVPFTLLSRAAQEEVIARAELDR